MYEFYSNKTKTVSLKFRKHNVIGKVAKNFRQII